MQAITFVDAHHHFQDIEHHYYPWLCDKHAAPKLESDLTQIRRNYLIEDYLAEACEIRARALSHLASKGVFTASDAAANWLILLNLTSSRAQVSVSKNG